MIDIYKRVRILRGKHKGETGTVVGHKVAGREIGNVSFLSEGWIVLLSNGKKRPYKETDLEVIEEAEDE